ncbi:MAG: VCBS repeat-containing protein [Bdellovibrionales bacterium]|nr:VCBS repeat-containing protein [Bdellovibrionales bacterium]
MRANVKLLNLNIYLILFSFSILQQSCKLSDNKLRGEYASEPSNPTSPAFNPSFLINNGDLFTSKSFVQINMQVDGAQQYSLHTSLASCEDASTWKAVVNDAVFDLSNLNSKNDIYVKFKKDNKLSSCLKQTITHDNQPPHIISNLSFDYTNSPSDMETPIINFNLPANDVGLSGIKNIEARVLAVSGVIAEIAPWTALMPGEQLTLSSSGNWQNLVMELRSVDNAGNVSPIIRSTTFGSSGQSLESKVNFSGIVSSLNNFYIVDIENDGDKDLLVYSSSERSVFLFKNDGNENFSRSLFISSAMSINEPIDIDNDGDLDIPASSLKYEPVIYVNLGSGNYKLMDLNLGRGTVHYSDLNNDSQLDAFYVSSFTTVPHKVLWNMGNMSFLDSGVEYPDGIEFEVNYDLNNDGSNDLIYVNKVEQKIEWYKSLSDKTLTKMSDINISKTATSYNWVDFDGDSDVDLVIWVDDVDSFFWLENNNLNFTEHLILNSVGDVDSIKIFDLDKDTDLDIVYYRDNSNDVVFLKNDGAFNFSSSILYNSSDNKFMFYDHENDGDLDIVGNAGTLFLNNGSQVFSNAGLLSAGIYITKALVEDLDGDNILDFIYVDSSHHSAVWRKHNGSGVYTDFNISSIDNQIYSSAIGDLNGDGFKDIIVYTKNDQLFWLENDQNYNYDSLHSIVKSNDMQGPFLKFHLIDIDKDGDLDFFISTGNGTQSIHMYKNDGIGNFTETNNAVNTGSPRMPIYFYDFNGDTEWDIINLDSSGKINVYTNNGSEIFSINTLYTDINIKNYAIGDLEGDGDLDLFFISNEISNGGLYKLVNDGSNNFTKVLIDANVNGAFDPFLVSDIDSDGDIDLIAEVTFDTNIYANDGVGNYIKVYDSSVYADSYQVIDIDNDGDLDLVSYYVNKLTILKNNGGFSFTQHQVYYLLGSYPLYNSISIFNMDGDVNGDLEIFSGHSIGGKLIYFDLEF